MGHGTVQEVCEPDEETGRNARESDAKCFRQATGILKAGGIFMICNESDGTDAAGLKYEKIIDGMKVHTAGAIETALRKAGFSDVRTEHHPSKPWITVLAKK